MTPKSLGLRNGSYGSLQPQQSNGALQNHTSYGFPRKSSKVLLSRHKERERCIACICRYLCRGKVGMVILVVFALLVFASSFFTVSKGSLLSRMPYCPSVQPCHEVTYSV